METNLNNRKQYNGLKWNKGDTGRERGHSDIILLFSNTQADLLRERPPWL